MQAMSHEGMGLYLTRRSPEAAARMWGEVLRLALAACPSPSRPQLYFLSDLSVAAVMQLWPDDRVSTLAWLAVLDKAAWTTSMTLPTATIARFQPCHASCLAMLAPPALPW
jgi:hypothetical protein